jgi:hypothetical protein
MTARVYAPRFCATYAPRSRRSSPRSWGRISCACGGWARGIGRRPSARWFERNSCLLSALRLGRRASALRLERRASALVREARSSNLTHPHYLRYDLNATRICTMARNSRICLRLTITRHIRTTHGASALQPRVRLPWRDAPNIINYNDRSLIRST